MDSKGVCTWQKSFSGSSFDQRPSCRWSKMLRYLSVPESVCIHPLVTSSKLELRFAFSSTLSFTLYVTPVKLKLKLRSIENKEENLKFWILNLPITIWWDSRARESLDSWKRSCIFRFCHFLKQINSKTRKLEKLDRFRNGSPTWAASCQFDRPGWKRRV